MVEGYPHGLGGWGVGAVFKEGGRLQVRYFSLLAPFIFAFVLPTTLLQLLEVLGLAWWVAGNSPFLPPGPHHPHTIFAAPPLPPAPSGRDFLILLAISLVTWLLVSLAVASVSKVVQYVYSDHEEDPSVISSIFKSLPGAIFRLLVTSLWVLLLTILTVFTVSLPFAILGHYLYKHATIFLILQQVFVSVAGTILGFFFLLSQEVAVLEPENYGHKALKRSAKLVEEKLLVALVLFVFTFLVGGLLSNGSSWVASLLATGKLPPWTVYILAVVFAVLYLLFLVYVLLVTVVLYFSSKVKYDGEGSSLPVDNPYNVVPAEEQGGIVGNA